MLATTTVCWMSLWRSASNNCSISLVEPCLDSIPTFLNFVFSSLQFCINFLRYHSECFLYIYTKLGRGLQELYIVIVRHILSLFLRNFPVVPHRQVRLATYEDEGCLVRFNALLGLVEPGGDVLEAVHVADVVGEDGPDTVPIIRLGDGTEPLLARGVPQLKFYPGPILQSHKSGEKVHANCWITDFRKFSIRKIPENSELIYQNMKIKCCITTSTKNFCQLYCHQSIST